MVPHKEAEGLICLKHIHRGISNLLLCCQKLSKPWHHHHLGLPKESERVVIITDPKQEKLGLIYTKTVIKKFMCVLKQCVNVWFQRYHPRWVEGGRRNGQP